MKQDDYLAKINIIFSIIHQLKVKNMIKST